VAVAVLALTPGGVGALQLRAAATAHAAAAARTAAAATQQQAATTQQQTLPASTTTAPPAVARQRAEMAPAETRGATRQEHAATTVTGKESHSHTVQKEDQHLLATPEHQVHYELVPLGAAVLLHCVTCCGVLAAAVLMACCMYDTIAHWCHRAHFHSCQRKVQRVHEVFLKRKGEPTLCPCCVEDIGQPSPTVQPVVFLCGHRFHMYCANKWFRDNPDKAGRCPLCEGTAAQQVPKGTAAQQVPKTPDPANLGFAYGACCQGSMETANDEALSFILGSLHRRYPEIISEDNVHRWASCHTETWLSELRCPRYNSIFTKTSERLPGSRQAHAFKNKPTGLLSFKGGSTHWQTFRSS